MSDLSFEARALVGAARAEPGLSAEEKARVRARLVATAGAGALAFSGSSAKAAGAKFVLSVKGWILGGASLVLASGGIYYAVERTAPPAGPGNVEHHAANAANVPTANAPTANAATTLNAPTSANAPGLSDAPSTGARSDVANAPARSPSVSSVTRPAPSANKDTGFAEDAQLLRDVHAALAAGEPARALSLLNARNATGVPGVLAEEREAARIVTLCTMGRTTEARTASNRFLAAHASSPLAERVRKACQEADRGVAGK